MPSIWLHSSESSLGKLGSQVLGLDGCSAVDSATVFNGCRSGSSITGLSLICNDRRRR